MTSSTDADEIRAEIETTRAGLSREVNQLGDRVNPANIVQRQKEKVVDTFKGSVFGFRNHITGFADDVKSPAGLIPASKKEAEAAANLKEQAQPLLEQLTSTVKEAAGNLQEPAQRALETVKSTTTDAVSTVKDEGTSAAGDVKARAQEAKDAVQNQASS